MFKSKNTGVFATKNLHSLTENLTKNELQSLISIIQNKIRIAYYNRIDLGSDEEFLKNFPTNFERDIEILKERYKNGIKCPKCGHSKLNKNGRTNNRQRYICKNCRTTFDERSFSPLSNTKLSLDTWLKYCRFMIEGGTIKYCAEKVSVSVPTSFFMRHRILDVLNLSLKNQTFEGIVCADEYNLNESFKGKSPKKTIEEERYFHNFEYSDLSRCVNWTFRNTHYLSHNPEKYMKPIQVKITTAMDRNGHILTRIVENPYFKPYSKEKYQDLLYFFQGKLHKDSILCAFNAGLYGEVIHKLKVNFKKAPNRIQQDIYSINHVFMYNKKLSSWLSNFHGVATKYLNNYLAWHSFLFMLQELNEIMQFSTKNLSITKKEIQNRKVEFI